MLLACRQRERIGSTLSQARETLMDAQIAWEGGRRLVPGVDELSAFRFGEQISLLVGRLTCVRQQRQRLRVVPRDRADLLIVQDGGVVIEGELDLARRRV